MKHVRLPISLFAVIAAAFGGIYLVESYLEGRTGAGLPFQELHPQPSSSRPFYSSKVHQGLSVAAMTGNTEQVRSLLDAGVSPNARDSFGIRALARATLWGHYETVKLLLEKGGDVNERERLGVTLLMLAANQGDKKLLEVFLEHGADVNARSEDGETALSAARRKGLTRIVEILLGAGAIDLKEQETEAVSHDAMASIVKEIEKEMIAELEARKEKERDRYGAPLLADEK